MVAGHASRRLRRRIFPSPSRTRLMERALYGAGSNWQQHRSETPDLRTPAIRAMDPIGFALKNIRCDRQ